MIESKYTIEYVNPELKKKNKPKLRKSILGFIFSGILLAGLAFILIANLPKNKVDKQTLRTNKTTSTEKKNLTLKDNNDKEIQQASLPSNTQDSLTKSKAIKSKEAVVPLEKEVVVKTPNKISKKTPLNNKPTEQDAEIEKSLASLKIQLQETQQKNQELASELDAQIMENMELSSLLEDSLYKINKKDKTYINELKKLEKNAIPLKTDKKIEKVKTASSTKVDKGNSNQTPEKTITNTKPQEIENKVSNQIDLSTTSQVDAIIAAMQEKTRSSTSSNAPEKQVSDSKTASNLKNEASKVGLQDEINHIINNNNADDKNKFQKSLNKI